MKPKRFWLIRPLNILLIVVSLTMCGALFFADKILFFIFTPIVLVLDVLGRRADLADSAGSAQGYHVHGEIGL